MKLIKGEFKEKLGLLFAPSIKAGFPSPAEDYLSDSLDFNRDLIKHPEATFYAVVDGDSMTGLGIHPGDIAVIDKSLEPSHGDIVVSYINEEFNIKQLDLTHQKDGYIELRSGNPKYPTFRINEDDHFRVWGVVVYTIKKWKQRMYGIVDCDNCYVSCERVFRPDLEGKPVIVLSNLFGILNKFDYS